MLMLICLVNLTMYFNLEQPYPFQSREIDRVLYHPLVFSRRPDLINPNKGVQGLGFQFEGPAAHVFSVGAMCVQSEGRNVILLNILLSH